MRPVKILLPFLILLLLLTLYSLQIPFFWDSAFFSSLSLHFFENGFNGFIAPEAFDTGGFPLYSTYLTCVWKLFGKSLAASHLAMFPFLAGLLFEFYKLCKRYLNEKTIIWALLLFIAEPVILTQSMLMGYDILVAYFFLLALNALYDNKNLLYSIALLLLCLVSVRGIMLGTSLFMIDIIRQGKIEIRLFLKYLPSFIILMFWTWYHEIFTGWYFFSPYREDNAEEFSSVEMIFRQLIYIVWKSIDLGRLALWLIFLFFGILYFRKEKTPQHKELLIHLFIPFLILSAFMILILNPIGHKYFLVIFILLNLAVCYFIQQILNKSSRILLFSLLIVSLMAGNFILYPQRYGNAWDSSLKVLPYFALEKQMKLFTFSQHIESGKIGTQFPLTKDPRSSELANHLLTPYSDIEDKKIGFYPFFLYSNIINTNRIDDIETVRQNWIVVKKLQGGQVELILYRNPDLSVW